MNNFNKVIWPEGAFLNPQHFQQQDRYHEHNLQKYISLSRQNHYGFLSLQINKEMLLSGNFQLSKANLVFHDGTVYTPSDYELNKMAISIPKNTPSTILYLVLSTLSEGVIDTSFIESENHSRYFAFEKKVSDSLNIEAEPKEVTVARYNTRLVLEENLSPNISKLPVAFISSDNEGCISIEEHYVPPFLSVQNNIILKSYINEIYGLIVQKGKSLAQAVNDPNRGGTIEVIDFLLLQTVNRYQAYLQHVKESAKSTHPEELFIQLSTLCADLMTFSPERIVDSLPIYNHDDLSTTFLDLMFKLRKSLSMMIDQRVLRIDLDQRDAATYIAQTPAQSILDAANFVLAVKADLPTEDIRNRLPNTMKITTVEKIQELVQYQVPGVKLLPLATAPRELPFHTGYVYFELERTEGYWELFDDSSAMAFHVSGDFPNINFEFWAIKPTN